MNLDPLPSDPNETGVAKVIGTICTLFMMLSISVLLVMLALIVTETVSNQDDVTFNLMLTGAVLMGVAVVFMATRSAGRDRKWFYK